MALNAGVPRKLTRANKAELKRRHKIENLFCRLKHFKRIRHRMDALASVFEAQIHMAFCFLLVPQLPKVPVS